jgi:hypothetical protein
VSAFDRNFVIHLGGGGSRPVESCMIYLVGGGSRPVESCMILF